MLTYDQLQFSQETVDETKREDPMRYGIDPSLYNVRARNPLHSQYSHDEQAELPHVVDFHSTGRTRRV